MSMHDRFSDEEWALVCHVPVGARRQHFALLCAALYNNFAARLAHRDRLRQQAA